MQAAVITHPDGEMVRVSRESADETNFAVEDMPAGRELSWDGVASPIANAITTLRLDDFRPRGEVDFALEPGPTVEFWTFDGLVVTLRLTEPEENEVWVELEARAVDEAEEAIATEAQELTARWAAWTYQIPSYSATHLKKRVEELLKEPVVEEPPEDLVGPPIPPPGDDEEPEGGGQPAEGNPPTEGGDGDEPADVEGGEGDEPADVEGGEGDEPAEGEGGEGDEPADVEGGEGDEPAGGDEPTGGAGTAGDGSG